jgi:hypothetical protein
MLATDAGKAPKVSPSHLERLAYVYVRQSTVGQVRRNPEGRENQEALAERAVALGWSSRRVRMIDADLGLSGKSADGRQGFSELVSARCLWDTWGSCSATRRAASPATTPTGTRSWICAP